MGVSLDASTGPLADKADDEVRHVIEVFTNLYVGR